MTEDYLPIIKRLERIAEEVAFLRQRKKRLGKPSDLAKRDPGYLIEHSLQLAIEAVLDTGRNIIAIERLPKPADSEAIFNILTEAKILSKQLASRMKGMGGMRNLLVHEYFSIDYNQLFSNLKRLAEFEDFVVEIKNYLKNKI